MPGPARPGPAHGAVSGSDRFPTITAIGASPQVAVVDDTRRESTSDNDLPAYCRQVLVGYARVSTPEQNPAHQIQALTRAGVSPDDVDLDYASGAKASRPEWDLVLRRLRGGDTLVITRLDRLGRSILHLVTLGAQPRECGVGLRVLEQGIDTATAEGRAMFGMLSVLAEFQRESISANTGDGLAAARARGRKGGRKPRLSPAQAAHTQQLYDARTHTVAEIASLLGLARPTVHGYLNRASVERLAEQAAEPAALAAARAELVGRR